MLFSIFQIVFSKRDHWQMVEAILLSAGKGVLNPKFPSLQSLLLGVIRLGMVASA
jgi:hypothetical protein